MDDALLEGSETVVLTLEPYFGYAVGPPAEATVTIADDVTDDGPQVSIVATDASAAEVGGDGALFTLTRTGSTSAELTVYYDIGGTAENGLDYTALAGQVTFAAGSPAATVEVSPVVDDISEADEKVELALRSSPAYQIAVGLASAMIANQGGNKPDIKFLDAAKKNPVTELAVAKWNGAYSGVSDKLRNTLVVDIFDKDPDRFHIQVRDPDKAGEASIEVYLSTYSEAVSDGATAIVLAKKAGTTDMFETADNRGQVLISNDADNRLGADGVANNFPNDRTHHVMLGSEVTVQYGAHSKTATVPALKVVPLHATVLVDANNEPLIGEPFVDTNGNGIWDAREDYKDVDGDAAYTVKLSSDFSEQRVNDDVWVMNESYAQVGVWFNLTLDFRMAPAQLADGVITVANGPLNGGGFTAQETALLATAAFFSPNREDLEV